MSGGGKEEHRGSQCVDRAVKMSRPLTQGLFIMGATAVSGRAV